MQTMNIQCLIIANDRPILPTCPTAEWLQFKHVWLVFKYEILSFNLANLPIMSHTPKFWMYIWWFVRWFFCLLRWDFNNRGFRIWIICTFSFVSKDGHYDHSVLITLKLVDSRRGRSFVWRTPLGNLVWLREALHITCPCVFCYIWWNRFGEFGCKVSEWCSNPGGSVFTNLFHILLALNAVR